MGKPSDRVGLAAARRMLDEVAFAHAILRGVRQEFPDHIKLVIPREDLHSLLLACLLILPSTIWA